MENVLKTALIETEQFVRECEQLVAKQAVLVDRLEKEDCPPAAKDAREVFGSPGKGPRPSPRPSSHRASVSRRATVSWAANLLRSEEISGGTDPLTRSISESLTFPGTHVRPAALSPDLRRN